MSNDLDFSGLDYRRRPVRYAGAHGVHGSQNRIHRRARRTGLGASQMMHPTPGTNGTVHCEPTCTPTAQRYRTCSHQVSPTQLPTSDELQRHRRRHSRLLQVGPVEDLQRPLHLARGGAVSPGPRHRAAAAQQPARHGGPYGVRGALGGQLRLRGCAWGPGGAKVSSADQV